MEKHLKPVIALQPKTPLEEKMVIIWKKVSLIKFINKFMGLTYRGMRDKIDGISIEVGNSSSSLTDFINQALVPLRNFLDSECGMFLDNAVLAEIPHQLPLPTIDTDLLPFIDPPSSMSGSPYNLTIINDVIQLFEKTAKDLYQTLQESSKTKNKELKFVEDQLKVLNEFSQLDSNLDLKTPSVETSTLLAKNLKEKLNVLVRFLNYRIQDVKKDFSQKAAQLKLISRIDLQISIQKETDLPLVFHDLQGVLKQLLDAVKNNITLLDKVKITDSAFERIRSLKELLETALKNLNQLLSESSKVESSDSLNVVQEILVGIVGPDAAFKKYTDELNKLIQLAKTDLATLSVTLSKEDLELKKDLAYSNLTVQTDVGAKLGRSPSMSPKKQNEKTKASKHMTDWIETYNNQIIPKKMLAFANMCIKEMNADPVILQDCLASLLSFIVYQPSPKVSQQLTLAATGALILQEAKNNSEKENASVLVGLLPVRIVMEYINSNEIHEGYFIKVASALLGYLHVSEKEFIENMRNYIIHNIDSPELFNKAYGIKELQSTACYMQHAVAAHFDLPSNAFAESKHLAGKDFVSFGRKALIWAVKFNKPDANALPHLFKMAYELAQQCKNIVDEKNLSSSAYTPYFFSENTEIHADYKKLDALIKQLGEVLNKITEMNYWRHQWDSLVALSQPVQQYRNNHTHSHFPDSEALKKSIASLFDGTLLAELKKAIENLGTSNSVKMQNGRTC